MTTINDTINSLDTMITDKLNAATALVPNSTMFYRGMDKELQRLEIEIRQGLRSFVTVGKNLATIQEKGLYKLRGFDSFEKYCKDTLDISRQQGYRLINASKIYTMLKDSYKGGKLPQSESQCRPLCDPDLSNLDVTLIWAIVVESGSITALSISKAIKQYRGDYSEPDKQSEVKQNAEIMPFALDAEKTDTETPTNQTKSENSENNATDLPLIGVPELKVDAPEPDKVTPIGYTPEDKKDTDKVTDKGTEVTNVSKGDLVAENLLLKAQVQELELKLLKAQNETKGTNSVPRSKMAILLYKAGFNVLLKSVTEDQKNELTELYNNLTGR